MRTATIPIELLSPARDLKTGLEALACGADAIYIGAEAFGARQAAGNSVEDISKLTQSAHAYGAKVYVTINTILFDSELQRAYSLILQLKNAGVDALITQDTALLSMHLPLPLHASTQMDVSTSEKVRELGSWGFEQVVLARELGIAEIRKIHIENPGIRLEAFIHGALCVSYSGRCYASYHCFRRSANRGECAQFCRLAFDLEDAQGRTLVGHKHLLSLKDMNRAAYIEKMMDSGVSSFKIEGRLKDIAYVKNTTAYYRSIIDKILKRRNKDYRRSSYGESHLNFSPDILKTFNRGFTSYFIEGREDNPARISTPKVVGEKVGHVKEIRRNYFIVGGTGSFHNGDGLCFFNENGDLRGFRVNRVDNNKIFPFGTINDLRPKMPVYRNHDSLYEREIEKPTPMRTISVSIIITETEEGFCLSAEDETGRQARLCASLNKEQARTPQHEMLREELMKSGGTPFAVSSVEIRFTENYFIPKSVTSQWRRTLLGDLLTQPIPAENPLSAAANRTPAASSLKEKHIDFSANVSNSLARRFYLDRGAASVDPAYEIHEPEGRVAIMTCKHCIRYIFGQCLKHRKCPDSIDLPFSLPKDLFLRPSGEETPHKPNNFRGTRPERFPLEFDCRQCRMLVMKE